MRQRRSGISHLSNGIHHAALVPFFHSFPRSFSIVLFAVFLWRANFFVTMDEVEAEQQQSLQRLRDEMDRIIDKVRVDCSGLVQADRADGKRCINEYTVEPSSYKQAHPTAHLS